MILWQPRKLLNRPRQSILTIFIAIKVYFIKNPISEFLSKNSKKNSKFSSFCTEHGGGFCLESGLFPIAVLDVTDLDLVHVDLVGFQDLLGTLVRLDDQGEALEHIVVDHLEYG